MDERSITVVVAVVTLVVVVIGVILSFIRVVIKYSVRNVAACQIYYQYHLHIDLRFESIIKA